MLPNIDGVFLKAENHAGQIKLIFTSILMKAFFLNKENVLFPQASRKAMVFNHNDK